MRKKLILGLLAITMVVVPFFSSACAEEKLTQEMELSMAIFMPPFAAQVTAYQEWADKINEQTEGMVTITIYPAGSLLSPDDMWDGVKSGMAEIGDMTLGGDTDLFPLSNILTLPFLDIGESQEALDIWLTLQDEYSEMRDEFEDVKVLFYSGSGADAFALHSTNEEIRAPEDFAGVKVQAESGLVAMMEELGAAPVMHSNLEWYTDLQTGIIDAIWMNWMAVGEMGLLDFLKYDTIFPSGCMFGEEIVFMNLETWESLPGYVQDIIEDLRPWVEARILELTSGSNAAGLQTAQDAGNTIITLTSAEEDAWYQVALPIHLAYLADLDDQGLPATEIYERARELAAENE